MLVVAACKAPDGSYWALQSWQRIQPLRGLPRVQARAHEVRAAPLALARAARRARGLAELDLRGPLARRLRTPAVRGRAVRGYKTPNQAAYDPYARFFYIDTLNSPAGSGWKRASAVVTRVPTGAFCLTFVPLPAPPGYPGPPGKIYPSAAGDRHRVTVMGPGVTPVLRWEGAALGRYDRDEDSVYNKLWDEYLGSDRGCAPER